MLLTPDRETFGGIKFGEPRGTPGLGFFRLTIPLICEIAARPKAKPVAALGSMRASVTASAGRGKERHLLGSIAPDHALEIRSQTMDYDIPVDLIVDMDRARIEAIEQMRQGDDLTIRAILTGWITVAGVGRIPNSVEVPAKTIPQATWLRVLDSMGYGKAIVVEVPVLTSDVCEDLAKAATRLESAKNALNRGDYRGAVAACREVLEAIEHAPLQSAGEALPNDYKTWTKAQRFRNLRSALARLAAPAHHTDPVSAKIDWNRNEALAIVAAVAAELMRCCDELQQNRL